jgi:hypothetical protein
LSALFLTGNIPESLWQIAMICDTIIIITAFISMTIQEIKK